MRRLFQTFMAVTVLATGAVTFSAPQAEAQSFRERQRFVERFCARNPGARDCREFRRDARRWDDRRYQRWYRDNYRERNRNDAAAAAIFGFAAGAIAGSAASGNRAPEYRGGASRAQAARCAARYRTYDARTNTYVANSAGERRVCNL
ncbi:BA14K family protein [Aureimonas sp. ME7]|uniref:BA14K family protein n=1 Tax=Aureimonas sp. ME7 TaxID=2744252 RepID=UPI0015F73A09|nr:BA14K family protein [Aureimonas sp. ME7]